MIQKVLGIIIIILIHYTGYTQTVYEEFTDGKIYVKFSKESLKGISKENPDNISLTKLDMLERFSEKYGITKVYKPFHQANDDDNLPCILKIEFTQKHLITNFIEDLNTLKGVEYAEKVRLNKTHVVPNDPLFATANGSTHLNQINAQDAWDVFHGSSNITVAIIDNSVMSNHADLVGNTYTNTAEANGLPGVDDDGNGYIDDINGYDVADMDGNTNPTNMGQDHGTHCAGIAGANNNNALGVASIGWNIKIIPVKCSHNNTFSTIVDYGYEGIIYAVKAKAKIISCSWGNSGGFSQTEQYVIDYAWNRGCLIFASAGNINSTTPNYPGAYNHVYCVASVESNDVKSTISNYGTWVDISAPGSNILSTTPYTSSPNYLSYSGTSMSTPLVSGLAALMLSKSPNMTRSDVLHCISSTAANIYTLAGNSAFITGNLLGAGRLDAAAAMSCAATYSALPPVANFYAFLPSTCPNTPVSFTDSSLYQPTSWNWVFQGGTPATSTLSNPSVLWSVPGTYSVSLTVTNLNGTSAKTKLSYITVSAPSSPVFSEGFEGTQFLPAGWQSNNIWNDNLYWQRATGVGGFGNSSACAVFDNYNMNAPGEHDEMRSPKFDFSNVASVRLRFDVAHARYSAFSVDTLEVKMSTDCGISWTSIYLKSGSTLATAPDQFFFFTPNSGQWRRDSIDISLQAAGQGNVMFSFINKGGYGQAIYIDNINLAFPTPTLSIANTNSICENPAYTFSNTSLAAANYTWTFQGGLPSSSTASNPVVSYTTPGTYTLNLTGINGTVTSSVIQTITVLPFPTISSLTGSFCSQTTYTLNGSGASSYTWSSPAGQVGFNPDLIITPTTNSTYTLTGSNGLCESEGIYVINVVPSPSLTVSDATICTGNTVTLTATGGASSYSWSTGSTSFSIQTSPSTTSVYTVTGSDAQCSSTKTVMVRVNALPVSVISLSNTSCFNSCDGKVNAATSGGSSPFTYSIGSCHTLPCENLCPGTYTLYTSNNEGCQSGTTVSIVAPTAVQSAISTTHAACDACPDGALSVSPSGGTAPYSYTWNPSGGNGQNATGLLPGCYTVNIADINGCATETNSCISSLSTGIPTFNTELLRIYPNPAKTQLSLELPGMVFRYKIYNSIGQLILEKKNNQNLEVINVISLARGVYFIEIQSSGDPFRKKLILE